MEIKFTEDFDPNGFVVSVSADDGYTMRFYVDPEKGEVTEIYLQGGEDFPPTVDFAASLYLILDGVPKSISAIISEINVKIPAMKEQFDRDVAAQDDYEDGRSFYYNNGRI